MKQQKLPVKCGLSTLPPMTKAQALAYGNKNCLPADQKRAGFKVTIFESDPEIHFAHYFRICVGMSVKTA